MAVGSGREVVAGEASAALAAPMMEEQERQPALQSPSVTQAAARMENVAVAPLSATQRTA
jgi:hypothetical protein